MPMPTRSSLDRMARATKRIEDTPIDMRGQKRGPRLVYDQQFAKIDSNRTKGGCYKAYIAHHNVSGLVVGSGSSFSQSDIFTVSDFEITLVNLNEQGASDHLLTESPITLTIVPIWESNHSDENNKPIFFTAVVDLEDCP